MVLEFPSSRNSWRLDAVGLLAVIGETTTEACVEPMTASYLCLLPRLIPAPQALIRPHRRLALAGMNANVTGIYSGKSMPQLSYTASQLYPITKLEPLSVRVLSVKYRERPIIDANVEMGHMRNAPRVEGDREDVQPRLLRRSRTIRESSASFLQNYSPPQAIMRAKTFAPHNVLSLSSFLLTIGLLVWAVVIGDGPAAVAIILLAVATTLFCAASFWSLPTARNAINSVAPHGDVVIRTRTGAFLIVICDQNIASDLYYGSDQVRQLITTGFGSCVGTGTIIFMVAVILLGNGTWTMQAAMAVTYLLLNAVYWFVALTPSNTHWEFPLYDIVDITPDDLKDIHKHTIHTTPSFTNSLWQAILVSKQVGWVKRSGATPETEEWNQWLELAKENAQANNRGWDATGARDRIMRRGA